MYQKQHPKLFIIFFLLLFSISCGKNSTGPGDNDNHIAYSYQAPEQLNDGWTTAALADVGMSASPVISLMTDLLNRNHHVHGMLIIKDGKLVFEEYFSGEDMDITNHELNFAHKDFDRYTLHSAASVTKSITSVLVGIAIDNDFIRGIDEKMFSFFPDYVILRNAEKDKISIAHMLAMASGIPWDEGYPYDDSRNDLNQFMFHDDPVRYVLKKTIASSPGTQFIYNSGTTNLLGEIVRKTSGQSLSEFAVQYLFAPLGISSYVLVGCPKASEVALASSGLYLRPRDMAKIGQLYLQNGMWNGNRIVSSDWIVASVKESIQVPVSENPIRNFITSYGYQWWRGTFSTGSTDTYFAAGWGGQFIFVMPEVEMVVVLTSGDYDQPNYQDQYNIVNDFILPAVN